MLLLRLGALPDLRVALLVSLLLQPPRVDGLCPRLHGLGAEEVQVLLQAIDLAPRLGLQQFAVFRPAGALLQL